MKLKLLVSISHDFYNQKYSNVSFSYSYRDGENTQFCHRNMQDDSGFIPIITRKQGRPTKEAARKPELYRYMAADNDLRDWGNKVEKRHSIQ